MAHADADQPECWPALPLNSWNETYATLHMWTQIVGKVRLRLTPVVNHWWNIPLYVTARGLTTSRIPYGKRAFELSFDFIRHQLVRRVSTTLRQVFAKFSEFFMCWGFPPKNVAPGSPGSDDLQLGRPTVSPLLSFFKRMSHFQSRSLRSAVPERAC